LFIDVVADILPNGEYGWQTVALAYQEKSKEEVLHDLPDMKSIGSKSFAMG
jgi:hypothetical protein